MIFSVDFPVIFLHKKTMNLFSVTDPHQFLGLHEKDGEKVVRLWRPGWEQAFVEIGGKVLEARRLDDAGLFELAVESKTTFYDYRVIHASGLSAHDPYAFPSTFTLEDAELFSKGKHEKIYDAMGGRLAAHEGVSGVKFSVWAPRAQAVFLVGDFNHWHTEMHPMRLIGSSGVWELFIPGLVEEEKYKFYLISSEGHGLYKADPYGLQGEMRPNTASVVTAIDRHEWKDGAWMQKRAEASWLEKPINIYEVHLGSWKMQGSEFMDYREIAPHLAAYCKEMGYTHVELMPILSHPLDESWGYQVTGFYAISRRFGTAQDFQAFVDILHQNEIGLFFDWVPAHFPTDEHSIAQFDGTYLYEHLDPRKRHHPDWNTHIFNYGRYEVANFLLGSALFLFEKMHIDGLRVDAVSSMLFLDYGRSEGEWEPNEKGGRENFQAVHFLQNLNALVHQKFPGVLMMAEESHAFPGVTRPPLDGGLGFDLKWGLGWMHDTLRFFQTPEAYREREEKTLCHELNYYYDEKYMLCLSHDEVVYGKKSLIMKMPGNEWEKFANMRLLMSYMICHPGKKLVFMGGEFGQWHEWECKEELHWPLLTLPYHRKLQQCIKALNHLYEKHSALWKWDFEKKGYMQVQTGDVFAYLRLSDGEELLCIHNFSRRGLENYLLPFKTEKPLIEILNTDSQEYGGSGIMNDEIKQESEGIRLNLAPFSTLIIKYAD